LGGPEGPWHLHRRVEKIESLEAERENASPEVTVIDTDAGLLHLASIVKAADIRQLSAIASIAPAGTKSRVVQKQCGVVPLEPGE
jgi:hypothetical protein